MPPHFATVAAHKKEDVARPCLVEMSSKTSLGSLPRRGAALLAASSFRLSRADPTAHNTSQKHPGRGWSFPRGPVVIDVGLEGHWGGWFLFGYRLSVEVLKKKPLPLVHPKASISGEWAGLALTGGSLQDTSGIPVVGKEGWFGAIPRQGCFTVEWRALTWANCTFLLLPSLSSWDIWSFYQGYFGYQTIIKAECTLLRGVE